MKLLRRQLDILELLASQGSDGIALSTIASDLELPASSVHRLLHALTEIGFVARVPGHHNYRLGGTFLRLGASYVQHVGMQDVIDPYLERLSVNTGEVSFAAVRDGRSVRCVGVKMPRQVSTFFVGLGQDLPLHASAAAKALIFHETSSVLVNLLSGSIQDRYTEQTFKTIESLLADLEQGHRRGYWECNEELEEDVYAVAAPVFDSRKRPILSFTVLCRNGGSNRTQLAKNVVAVAQQATREIGALLAPHTIEATVADGTLPPRPDDG